jgi:A/G-specific adenine glycosylase
MMTSRDSVSKGEKRKLTGLARGLLAWSEVSGRKFPWRCETSSTYERIAVEVLLQRTTATAVSRFYESFFARFPSWASLGDASEADLEIYLRPLGLWRRRAKSLLGLARYASSRQGVFPENQSDHEAIPAVGQYVSNAIMLFQAGSARPLLDVNMARVIERYVRPRRLVDIRHDPWLQEAAHWLVRHDPVEVNWAVLDFGALVCRARSPLCTECPLAPRCAYAKLTRTRVTD